MFERGEVIRQRIVRGRLFERIQPLTALFRLAPNKRVKRHPRIIGIFLLCFLEKSSIAGRAAGGEEAFHAAPVCLQVWADLFKRQFWWFLTPQHPDEEVSRTPIFHGFSGGG